MSETPTAYSVEEHMFQQDEIQKRHQQQPDQQRSEQQASKADIERLIYKYGDACHYENISTERIARDALRDAIAERDARIAELTKQLIERIADRDATIAELRAEVQLRKDFMEDDQKHYDAIGKLFGCDPDDISGGCEHLLSVAEDVAEQIAALQSRVAELEAAISRWYADDGERLANIAVELLTPITEK